MSSPDLSPLISPDDPALAGYEIERELRGGGMSRLFVARDRRLGRRVVVKVLAPGLAAVLSVERFRREILLASSLQHPNIVPVLSAGQLGEHGDGLALPFFVMPYVDGESLRDRLLRGPLSVRETVSVARDMARALAFAHERGVVHRDIKPGNVLLASGAAMVSDFGVAKAVSVARRTGAGAPEPHVHAGGHTSLTGVGMSPGTPAYMAPEQVAADPDVDHRADLYALGIVSYEMLTGAPPFQGRTPQDLMRAQLSEPAPPIAGRRYDVPERLTELVEQCLEKDPARRPRSASDLLRRLEDPDVVSGAFASPPQVRRRRLRARIGWSLAGLALLLVVARTVWLVRRLTPDDAATPPAAARPVAPPSARAVVIGPLAPIGGDPVAAIAAQGLVAELATALAAVPGLRVGAGTPAVAVRSSGSPSPGASSSGSVAPGSASVPAIASAPADPLADENAMRVLGSVQHEGRQLRVLVRVVNVRADSTIWSGAFDGRSDSLLVLQGRVARAVADVLAGSVTQPRR